MDTPRGADPVRASRPAPRADHVVPDPEARGTERPGPLAWAVDRAAEPGPGAPPPGAVSLWLDGYDDIFSDFDPRPYGRRALSEDFLAEARRAVRERPGPIPELRLLLPARSRSPGDEVVIGRHLREYFQKHADRLGRERRQAIWLSLGVTVAGFLVMTTAALLRRQPDTVARTVLQVLLEPAGWFAVWFGLDQIFYGTRAGARELTFCRKLARADVVFLTYPEEEPASPR